MESFFNTEREKYKCDAGYQQYHYPQKRQCGSVQEKKYDYESVGRRACGFGDRSMSLYRQKITHNNGRTVLIFCQQKLLCLIRESSHVMYIPPDRKGKTTLCQYTPRPLLAILFILSIVLVYILVIVIVRIFQGARRKNGLLTLIKSNGSELLPVGDQ
jgi:hypothetical protein